VPQRRNFRRQIADPHHRRWFHKTGYPETADMVPAARKMTPRTSGIHYRVRIARPSDRMALSGYSLASWNCGDCGVRPPEICDAIRNAATTAGRLISLKNWSTESIVTSPNVKKIFSKGRVQCGLCMLITGPKHVCIGCPGNRQQRQNRNDGQCFHAWMVVFDCGQKRQSLAHFQDKPGKQSWPRRQVCPKVAG
jgi:hypothetical protein